MHSQFVIFFLCLLEYRESTKENKNDAYVCVHAKEMKD